MKLSKAIIKKYGISKKAWAIQRGKKTSSSKPTMARQRMKRSKARSFRGFAKRKGRSSKRSSGMGNLTGLMLGAAVYGAGREWVSNKIQPITSKIPAGQYADEVGLGVLSYFVASGKIPLINKIPYSREIGRAGLTIEAARIGAGIGGQYLSSGGTMTQTTNTTVSNSWQ